MAENQVYLIKSGQNSFVEETEAVVGISGGKVGIGTTHPQVFFHVTGDTQIDGDLTVKGDLTTVNSTTIQVDDKNIELGVGSTSDAAADGGGITLHAGTNNNKTFNWLDATDAWTSSEHLHLAAGKGFAADKLSAINAGQGLILSDTNGSGILVKGGKVGIHQPTPVYDLDVDGSGNFTSLYVSGNAVLTGEGSIFGKWEDGATEGEIYYTGGNVGVGTNNPDYKLHVVGHSVVDGNFIVNGTSGNLNVSNFNVSGDSIVLNYLGDALASSRGGLIVKDSSNASKSLEYVEGSDFWLSSESVQIADGKELQTDKVRAIDAGGLSLQDDGGNGIFVQDGGNVGIKNITPSAALDVSGSAKISTDLTVSEDIVAGGSISVLGGAFDVSSNGAIGNSEPGANDVIKWSSSEGKWIAGTSPGGGGSSSSEVPLAFAVYLNSANGNEHPIVFPDAPVGGYDDVPSIATDLEIEGDGPLVPYYISGLSNTGYYAVFAQDITVDDSYKLHTTFGGRDVFWRTGVDAGSIYYNLGDVSIDDNLTVGGNLTVNGTTTTVNTETVEIKDHNLVIASNAGYNQLTSEYPTAGDGYAGLYWGTGDNQDPSPISLTYQHNKGFAFEGGNVGIGTTNPAIQLQVKNKSTTSNKTQIGLSSQDGTQNAGISHIDEAGKERLSFSCGGFNLEQLTIKNNGNVGIGTSSPSAKLEVVAASSGAAVEVLHLRNSATATGTGSTIKFVNSTDGNSNSGSSEITALRTGTNDGELTFSTASSTGTITERLRIDSDGNVGIGTTDPGEKLHIEGSSPSIKIKATNQSGLAEIKLQSDAGDNNADLWSIRASNNQPANNHLLEFMSYSTGSFVSALAIDSDGNVGIGTTNPVQSLTIGSKVSEDPTVRTSLASFNAGDNAFLEIENTNTKKPAGIILTNVTTKKWTIAKEGDDHHLFIKNENDSVVATFKQGGNVGIGTTDPISILHVNKSINTTNTGLTISNYDNTAGTNQAIRLDFGLARNSGALKPYAGRILVGKEDDWEVLDTKINSFMSFNVFEENAISEKMRITSKGNVGIGTTNPSELLEVHSESATAAIEISAGKESTTTGEAKLVLRSLHASSGTVYSRSEIASLGVAGGDSDLIFRTTTQSSGPEEHMRIDSEGNVGIGTTNPNTRLTVGDGGGNETLTILAGSDSESQLRFADGTSGSSAYQGRIEYNHSTDKLFFGAGGITPVSIDSLGNFRIDGPAGKDSFLYISTPVQQAGDVHNAGIELVPTGRDTGDTTNYYGKCWIKALGSNTANGGTMTFSTRDTSNAEQEHMRINSAGNVGIGTTNPGTNKLDVQGAVSVGASATSTSAGYIKVQGYRNAADQGVLGHIRFDNQNEGNTAGKIEVYAGGSTTTGTMRFHTSGSENMRIAANGNVGIGTTNPGTKLHIDGGGTANSTYALSVYGSSSAASKPSVLAGFDNGSTSYTMVLGKGSRANGYLLGAFSSSNTFCFQMLDSGNLQNTNNSYGQLSDIKLKENVVNATPKLDDLNKVRVVNFNFKGDDLKQIGVVAQELEEIFPGLVDDVPDHDEDGNLLGTTTKSVKYSIFGPILIKAIQEQQQMIEDLKSQNASLESRISALES